MPNDSFKGPIIDRSGHFPSNRARAAPFRGGIVIWRGRLACPHAIEKTKPVSSALLPTYARAPLAFERGEGAWLVATNGERYLDFGAGIAVNALGHAHPTVLAAVTGQISTLGHVSNFFATPAQVALAWVAQLDGVSTVIPGARNTDQARANAAAGELPALPPELVDGVARLYDTYFREAIHDRW